MKIKAPLSAAAFAAAACVMAAPVQAAELPRISAATPMQAQAVGWSSSADQLNQYRDRYYRDRYRRGPRTSDVVAGVVLLGAIAAIASSSNRNRQAEPYRRPVPQRGDVQYRPQHDVRADSRGIQRAVDMCLDQVERGRDRAASVDNAIRNASGWEVSGQMESGERFACSIDNDGRIRNLDIGSYGGNYGTYGYDDRDQPTSAGSNSAADNQHSDDVYRMARAQQTGVPMPRSAPYQGSAFPQPEPSAQGRIDADLRPAYPGGPLPGEPGYAEAMRGY